ncbi:MAG: insulinase family protein [Planctomycetota bacterium]
MKEVDLFSQHELASGVILHHHRSKQWKKESLRIAFVGESDGDVAERSLGAYLFRHGHRRRRGMDRVSKYFQDLYGGGFSVRVSRTARHHLLDMRGMVVDGAFLPGKPNTFESLVEHAGAMLHEPWFKQRNFERDLLELERTNLLRAIDGLVDNKAQFADQRLTEEMFAGHPLAIPAYGRRDDVATAKFSAIVEALDRFAKEQPVLIYYVGSRSASAVKAILKRHLQLKGRSALRLKAFKGPAIRNRPKTFREQQEISQSRLAMGFRLEGYKRSQDLYPAHLGDAIFGGSSSSKLFRDVREKHSLAYSIHSAFEGGTGTLYVTAGTDSANLDRVTTLVKRHLKSMAAGKFQDQDRATALASIEHSLESSRDSAESMIGFHLGAQLSGRKNSHPAKVLRRYASVKPENVANVFERFKLDTVFRLEPLA